MSNYKKKDCTTIQGAANRLGVKRQIVEEWVDEGRVEVQNGLILIKTIELIKNELEKYVSLEAYLKQHDSEQFNSRYVRNREKYIDYLEANQFFGLNIIYKADFQYPYEANATFYFEAKDLNLLDIQSNDFFKFSNIFIKPRFRSL